MADEPEVRSSGLTAAEEVTREESKEFDKLPEPQLNIERERKFRTTGLARMRTTEWDAETQSTVDMLMDKVNEIIDREFYSALVIINSIYEQVREQALDDQDRPMMDRLGWPIWRRDKDGAYVEDWTRMSDRDRERYLYQLTLYLFEWEQRSADFWAEAMYAKAVWEDAFSEGYVSNEGPIQSAKGKDTIEARTAAGRLHAREDRYFAIFRTHISRRAESVVRTTTLIAQRLKDTLPSR